MIVISGGTGFVGSAVVRRLLDAGVPVRLLSREPGESGEAGAPGGSAVRGDLGDPASLRGLCDGASVLLSLASYVGSDEGRCADVNVRGTAALMAEARRAGVARVVHLSTCAVYGPGPHRGPAVGELCPAPVSAASRSRLVGEASVLAAGGTVLRAPLVTGCGDRWAVPALVDAFRRVPAGWGGGRGRASFIDVMDLARLVAALALTPTALPGGVLHAGDPEPVRNGELMGALARYGVLPHAPAAGGSLDWEACLAGLRARPGWVSERQFTLLAGDMWYRSDAVWELGGISPGPGPLARLEAAAQWYRARGGVRPDGGADVTAGMAVSAASASSEPLALAGLRGLVGLGALAGLPGQRGGRRGAVRGAVPGVQQVEIGAGRLVQRA
ncbi:NAD(P)-dependent oxidoreductase [Streptomyces sp. G-G2]|uniref:NAD-dependent epimerase/dehydratase family protein n=1 Tax=Streptomyces sp. G-G2 TaxID=3046201 RepID=UPI0024BAE1B7|nr:NAD(P)-dependent oxidoreductase [Streptomyces sp. G-G2]MDJ0386148.1 NAD(P)-dependent oxidoreductase [Streptomyces sp. G-G2]